MKFLAEFKESVEKKITDSTTILEGKMHEVKKDIEELDDKVNTNELNSKEVQRRMEKRMDKLEEQMKKSVTLGEKRNDLKDTAEVANEKVEDPVPVSKSAGNGKETVRAGDITRRRMEERKNEKRMQPPGGNDFRSSWARQVQEELE